MKSISWGARSGLLFAGSLILLAFALFTYAVFTFMPVQADWTPGSTALTVGVDWKGTFRPAVHALFAGRSPFEAGLYNPPWVLLPLIPFAFLSAPLGAAAMLALGIFASILAALRFGARPLQAVAFAISPFVLGNAVNGNIDWMVFLGAALPPQIGLLLVLAKPQIGLGIALFWLVEAWRQGRLRRVLVVFAPVVVAYLLTFLAFGFWPSIYFTKPAIDPYNVSLWPAGIPVGVALLVYSLRKRNFALSVASSPFFSPYLMQHSWSVCLFALLRYRLEFWLVWVTLWILRFWLHY